MEILIFLFGIIVVLLYNYLIFSYQIVWNKKLKNSEQKLDISTDIGLSIIVPFRNEEENLPNLISDLKLQKANNFEVIFIDDHSLDKSFFLCNSLIDKDKRLSVIGLPKGRIGKKQAIAFGVEKSKYNYIVTTDADCRVGQNWISSYQNCFATKDFDFIVAPVLMQANSLFERLQSLEFLSLIASGGAAALKKKPIMCNGANLGFKKELYLENSHIQNQKFASGDDMMLMLAAKRANKKIAFCVNEEIIVKTKAQPNLKSFFSQRLRWVSKAKYYSDFDVIYSGFLVLFLNIFILFSFVLGFFYQTSWILCLVLFVLKSIPDFLFLKSVSQWFNKKVNPLHFVLIQMIYPFYVVISAYGVFFKPKWKARKI